jgi:hypothetical protein
MKVGDLIREKEFPQDACGIIVEVGDLRRKKPYKVFCSAWGELCSFEKKYIQEECEVISDSASSSALKKRGKNS